MLLVVLESNQKIYVDIKFVGRLARSRLNSYYNVNFLFGDGRYIKAWPSFA